MDEVYANYYVKHQKNPADYRVEVNRQFPVEYFAVGMRKGDKTLRKKINAGLGRLQRNGQLKKINEKWFGTNSTFLGPDND